MNATFTQPVPRRSRRRQPSRQVHWGRIVWWTSLGYLAAVILWGIFANFVSEHWWLTALYIYLPRQPLLALLLVLIPAACVWHRRSILVNLVTALVILGPLMGFSGFLPQWGEGRGPKSERIRVAACRVGNNYGLPSALSEFQAIVPELVVLTRTVADDPLLDTAFADWHQWKHDIFFVASRFPIRLLEECSDPKTGRLIAASFEVDHLKAGKFRMVAVDLSATDDPTDGFGLRALISGARRDQIRETVRTRQELIVVVREFVETQRGGTPTLVIGDFESPVDATQFRNSWDGWINAFDERGSGYGYTAPCRTPWYWPEGTPWLRVDHVLTSPDWKIDRCWMGTQTETSHRLIGAILRFPQSSSKAP
jgi:hypothetical protein